MGGTNYYIEGLLFDKEGNDSQHDQEVDWVKFQKSMEGAAQDLPSEYGELIGDFRLNIPLDNKAAIEDKYSQGGNAILHDLLKIVDPKMGDYLHSRDTRKIINALFKYFKYLHRGLKESDV